MEGLGHTWECWAFSWLNVLSSPLVVPRGLSAMQGLEWVKCQAGPWSFYLVIHAGPPSPTRKDIPLLLRGTGHTQNQPYTVTRHCGASSTKFTPSPAPWTLPVMTLWEEGRRVGPHVTPFPQSMAGQQRSEYLGTNMPAHICT